MKVLVWCWWDGASAVMFVVPLVREGGGGNEGGCGEMVVVGWWC